MLILTCHNPHTTSWNHCVVISVWRNVFSIFWIIIIVLGFNYCQSFWQFQIHFIPCYFIFVWEGKLFQAIQDLYWLTLSCAYMLTPTKKEFWTAIDSSLPCSSSGCKYSIKCYQVYVTIIQSVFMAWGPCLWLLSVYV